MKKKENYTKTSISFSEITENLWGLCVILPNINVCVCVYIYYKVGCIRTLRRLKKKEFFL